MQGKIMEKLGTNWSGFTANINLLCTTIYDKLNLYLYNPKFCVISYYFFITRIMGRYAPQILAPVEGLLSRARKDSLRSLSIESTYELSLLAFFWYIVYALGRRQLKEANDV